MADNTKGIPFTTPYEGIDYPFMARDLAYQHGALPLGVREDYPDFSLDDVYLVWFCYILGGWKALCSTALPDGRYYEVTYNKEKNVAYVDTYKKTHNIQVDILPARTD